MGKGGGALNAPVRRAAPRAFVLCLIAALSADRSAFADPVFLDAPRESDAAFRSPEALRAALARDALSREVSAAMREAVAKRLARVPAGRRLLAGIAGELPPICFSDGRDVAVFSDRLEAVFVNCRYAREMPGAPASDCRAALRWLLAEPKRIDELARRLDNTMAHELTHWRQHRLLGSGAGLPNDGRVTEMELEAKLVENEYYLESAERDPALLRSSLPRWKQQTRELWLLSWAPSDYLDATTKAYRSTTPGHATIPLSEALSRPSLSDRDRERLERMKAYYDGALREALETRWKVRSPEGLLLFAGVARRRCPRVARSMADRALQSCADPRPSPDLSRVCGDARRLSRGLAADAGEDPFCPRNSPTCNFRLADFQAVCLAP
jgi:hypothetical protein